MMKEQHKTTAIATASCIKYQYQLKYVQPPCMSAELAEYVDILMENPKDENLMTEFFDNFGTHALLSVEMGDKFVTKSSMSTDDYIFNQENGGHVAFNPVGGYMFFVGAAKAG